MLLSPFPIIIKYVNYSQYLVSLVHLKLGGNSDSLPSHDVSGDYLQKGGVSCSDLTSGVCETH